ncbi:MAG: hypothetical protein QXH80_02190 [Candidatus Nanoarchaeia archaeon]
MAKYPHKRTLVGVTEEQVNALGKIVDGIKLEIVVNRGEKYASIYCSKVLELSTQHRNYDAVADFLVGIGYRYTGRIRDIEHYVIPDWSAINVPFHFMLERSPTLKKTLEEISSSS